MFWIGHLADGNPEGVCKYTSTRHRISTLLVANDLAQVSLHRIKACALPVHLEGVVKDKTSAVFIV